MSHFSIRCRKCDKVLENTYCAFCEHCVDALLITEYHEKEFKELDREGVWKYNWLPVHNPSFNQPGPVVYRSDRLGSKLGLENLYIAFNGYWPERGAFIKTCTFKEFEAAVVLQNARENGVNGLVVASAGNTARAFAHLSVVSGYPVIIVVPRMCLFEMWYLVETIGVPTVAIRDGDYSDSIDMARRIASIAEMPFEGGAKNIAKRDGLGISLLEAVRVIGRLPDHYFQAVGSGTGALGVWEMAERFLRDGRYGDSLPTLHLAQNLPFAPMVKAWQRNSRELKKEDLDPALIGEITTRVLSNRYPPYSTIGGVFDALTATNGRMYGIRNEEVFEAMELFEKLEGIDIVPAAGVAVAALINAVKNGSIKSDEIILLNITGGGEKRLEMDTGTFIVDPIFIQKDITDKELEKIIWKALKRDS